MERVGIKTRDIRFFSQKNQEIVCVHKKIIRNYAKYLESNTKIESYIVNIPLDEARFVNVQHVDIRSNYFRVNWSTDFKIKFTDGKQGIREIVKRKNLGKRSIVEQLELSRRYWKIFNIEWKVVVFDE